MEWNPSFACNRTGTLGRTMLVIAPLALLFLALEGYYGRGLRVGDRMDCDLFPVAWPRPARTAG